MQAKTSNIDVKKINRNKIYKYICQEKKSSNASIATTLGMSMPTVLQNTKELLEEGLIEEAGYFESTGGRKAKMISPVFDHKLAIGVDITHNHIAFALVDLSGTILKHCRIKMPFVQKDDYNITLAALLKEFVQSEDLAEEQILGVGVSLAGLVQERERFISYSHVLNLRQFSCDKICEHIPWDCYFINDANAAAMAELWAMEKATSFVYLFLSNSVGGAIVYNGRIFSGENYGGGEFGHICVEPEGLLCSCGKKGCLDPYCSATHIEDQSNARLEDFFLSLSKDDPKSKAIWQSYTKYLLRAIDILYMSFNSDIVLGGYVGKYLAPHLDSLRQEAQKKNIFGENGNFVKICKYYEEASALGAALHFIDAFIQSV